MSSFNVILILLLVMLTSVAIFILQADDAELTAEPGDRDPIDPVFDEVPEIELATIEFVAEREPTESEPEVPHQPPDEPEGA